MKLTKKIAIIGVGLIGGSIALGLKNRLKREIRISGYCQNPKRSKLAKKMGIIDDVLFSLDSISSSVELGIIATPILTIPKIVARIAKKISADCVLMDVGSTKAFITKEVEEKFPNLCFIGTHPMAGNNFSGFEKADPFLFQNKPWIVTLPKRVKRENLEIVESLIEILGAKKIILEAELHDELAAFSSHLPLIFSSMLIKIASNQSHWKNIAKIASTGFRDTTRLASHDSRLKTEIILSNKKNIIKAFSETQKEINFLLKLIEKEESAALFDYFQKTKALRDKWLLNHFS